MALFVLPDEAEPRPSPQDVREVDISSNRQGEVSWFPAFAGMTATVIGQLWFQCS